MTETQVKQQLNALIDLLPAEQTELLLDYAVALRQQQIEPAPTTMSDEKLSAMEWEDALAAAESHWFQ